MSVEGKIMAKAPKVMPAQGDEDALTLYAAVGSALSFWEASEDALMDLFKTLCGEVEPVASIAYVQAPRKVRVSMIRQAIDSYGHRMLDDERSDIVSALNRLDKLAPTRNEIAHGHVSNQTIMETGESGEQTIMAQGHYLLPALSEGGWQQRTPRFHHTFDTIYAFQEDVRDQRWLIVQAQFRMAMREQEADQEAGSEWYMQHRTALDIAARKIPASDYQRYFKPMVEW
ncbi:hypothetical protein [Sphingobium fuliginis]|uniref:Uncharacterized protein n=1 Tax=Sphingobium fuliginis ATCC 27551 TaxID=1208342 RepID=A0A5B8CHK0_SPHSA|nr:hypothetical protein [Sphingobium fuliginis]QDC38405.1 hypothetical protein FIL70_15335 [Sphingobium fuliginis ATCC 27551]